MTMPARAGAANSREDARTRRRGRRRIVEMVAQGLTARKVLTARGDRERRRGRPRSRGLGQLHAPPRGRGRRGRPRPRPRRRSSRRRAKDAVLLAAIRPNGTDQVWDLEEVGGVQTVLETLCPACIHGALTVSGRTVGDLIADAPSPPTAGSSAPARRPGQERARPHHPARLAGAGRLHRQGCRRRLGATPILRARPGLRRRGRGHRGLGTGEITGRRDRAARDGARAAGPARYSPPASSRRSTEPGWAVRSPWSPTASCPG